MRLIAKKIWRAFPELDRFSDEHCAKFVRAAVGLSVAVVAGRVLLGLMALVVVAGAAIASVRAFERLQIVLRTAWLEPVNWLLAVVVCIVCGVIGLIAVLIVRDGMLRMAVRRVIRTLGRCRVCRYSLLGLPIGEGGLVVCPECGLQLEVNPALATLSVAADGVRRLDAVNVPGPPLPFWTARRVAWVRRVGRVLGVLLLVGATGWGSWTLVRSIQFARQARLAAAERPTAQMWADVRAKYVTPLKPGEPDATASIEQAATVLRFVSKRAWSAIPSGEEYPNLWWWTGEGGQGAPRDSARDRRNKARAVAMLDELYAVGVFGQMQELAKCRTGTSAVSVLPMGSVWETGWELRDMARELERVNTPRMQLAIETDDVGEYVAGLEAGLALAKFAVENGGAYGLRLGFHIEQKTLDRVYAALDCHPQPAWIDATEHVLKRHPRADIGLSIELERLLLLDGICWAYSRDGETAVRRAVSRALGWRDEPAESTGGWYVENRDDLESSIRSLREQLPRPAHQRDWRALAWMNDWHWEMLSRGLLVSFRETTIAMDANAADRAGVLTAVAIARFRFEHGRAPESLRELGEERFAALPADPWSGKPLGYRRTDPVGDPQQRHYLLYSIGADQTDDDGVPWAGPGMTGRGILWPGMGSGADYIVNDRNRYLP